MTEVGARNRGVLLVVRWPVGGIRTYLQGLIHDAAFRDLQITAVIPQLEESRILRQSAPAGIRWVVTPDATGSFSKAVLKTFLECRPALVHSHGFTSAVCSSIVCALTGTPHFVTAHDVFESAQFRGWRGELRRRVTELAISRATGIHFVTDDARDNVVSFMPRLSSQNARSFVVPHGVDIAKLEAVAARPLKSELGLDEDTLLIGFCGRFMAQKGFRVLVDAIALLKPQAARLQKFKVVAVGSGGFIREDKQYVEETGVRDYFLFEPLQANLAPTLKALDLLVMPSRWEASGLLAMEALVLGVPLIGTDCVGLRETLRGTPARVVKTGDSVALAEAISEELSARRLAAARAFISEARERFDQRKAYRSIRQMYARAGAPV